MAQTLRWPTSLKKQMVERRGAAKRGRIITLLAWFLFGPASVYLIQRGLVLPALICWVLMFVSLAGLINVRDLGLQAGQAGEEMVARELDTLPEEWYIVNDIVINGSQIDHVAIGPTGLFCIETKNWNNAGCDEHGNWYRFHMGQWVAVAADPARQNTRHLMALKKHLKSNGIRVNIESVVVLSNPEGKYDIRARRIPPGDTMICFLPELKQVLRESKGTPPLALSLAARIAEKIVSSNADLER